MTTTLSPDSAASGVVVSVVPPAAGRLRGNLPVRGSRRSAWGLSMISRSSWRVPWPNRRWH